MRKSFVSLLSLVLFLGVLLTVGCGGGGGGGSSPVATTSDGSLADLKGRVTYNGNAVSKATVYLMKTTSDETELSRRASILNSIEPDISVLTADGTGYQTTSDANGYYSFTQVPVGTYTVQALISPSIQISQPVVLGAISNLDLALKPTGSISGKITMDGDPVQGIVYLDGTSYMSIAGLDGSFKIMNVPVETTPYTLIPVIPGSYYSVRASSANASTAGKAPSQPAISAVQGSVRASSSGIYTFKNAPVQVTPIAGQDYPLGTLELVAAEATITGIAKIPGATDNTGITVSTDGGSTETDANGNYTLEGIPYGQQTISFSGYSNGKSYATSTNVLVDSPSKTINTVTLSEILPTTGNISGTITGIVAPAGQTQYPNSNINLYQNGEQVNSKYLYVSGTSASYDFSGIATGTYSIVIPAYNNYLLASVSITIAAGDNKTQDIALTWTKAAVSGTVTGVDYSHPATISLFQNGTLVTYNSNLYNSSTYYFIVNPGVYSVSVDTMSGYAVASYAVTLATGNQKTQDFSLTQTFPVLSSPVTFNALGTQITVTGSRFTANSAIRIDGSSVTTSYVSANQLTGTTNLINPGLHEVSVSNQGVLSNVLTGIPKQFTASPTITAAGTLGMTSYTLNWNSLSGATNGYTVYMNGVSVTSTTSNSYTFTGLAPNTSYTFGVEATGYSGMSASPRAEISITTSRVFNNPVIYNSNFNIGSLVRSFMFNGDLYAIGSRTTDIAIVKYSMATPNDGAVEGSMSLTPPMSGAVIHDLYVDANGVYVGWGNLNSTVIYIQRYSLNLTGSAQAVYSSTFDSGFNAKIRIKGNNNTSYGNAKLQALFWNDYGIASLTYLDMNLGAIATMSINLPVTPTAMEWTSYISSGNSPRTALILSAYSPYVYVVDSNPAFTASTTAFFSGTADDLAGSPNLGYAWGGAGTIHYVTNAITLVPGYQQTAFDANNRLYTINNSSSFSIARYSAVGNREDGIALPNLESPSFGKRVIHFDAANNQIVVIAPSGSNLGVMTFKVQN